jgi:hypothetical protein
MAALKCRPDSDRDQPIRADCGVDESFGGRVGLEIDDEKADLAEQVGNDS